MHKFVACMLKRAPELDMKKYLVVLLSIFLAISMTASLFNVYASDGQGTVEWVYEDTETKGD